MADENVQVKFGGDTSALDQASNKSVEDIGNVGKAAAGLTTVFRNLAGVARGSFGGAMFAEAREQISELTEKAREAGTEAIGLKEIFGMAFGGITAALSLPALVEFGEHMGEVVEKTSQQSQRLGIAVTTLSQWQQGMTIAGMSSNQFVSSATRLERSMSLAAGGAKAQSAAFKQMGIEITKTSQPTDVLLQIADKFKGMDDGPKKIALAMATMGRAGVQMIPYLNQGSEAIKEQQEEAVSYGATMDEQFVAKGLEVADAFNTQKVAVTGVKNVLFDEFAPVISQTVEFMNSLVKSFVESYREGGVVAVVLGTIKIAFMSVILAVETLASGIENLWTLTVTFVGEVEDAYVALGKAIYDALTLNFQAAADDINAGVDKMVARAKAGASELMAENAKFQQNAKQLMAGTDGKEHTARPETGEGDISTTGGGGAAKKPKDDAVQQWQAELTAKLQAEKNYFGDSKAEELAFWQEKLALTTAGSKDQQQVQQKIFELSKGIAQDQYRADMDNIEYKKQLAKDDYSTQMQLENQKLTEVKKLYGEDSQEYIKALREKETMERDHQTKIAELTQQGIEKQAQVQESAVGSQNTIINSDLAAREQHNQALQELGKQSASKTLAQSQQIQDQQIAQERNYENQIYSLKLAALQQEAAIQNLPADKKKEVNQQIEALEQAHSNKMAEIDDKMANQIVAQQDAAAKQAQQKWATVMDPITSAFSSAFDSIYNKSKTVGEAMKGVFVSLGETMINTATKAAGQWITKEIAKTVAHTAQTAIQTTASATAATTAAATQATQAVAAVMSNAAVAASAAFAATAAIPIIGPELAPEAAATAYAATAAFAPAASAAGGYDIPAGVNPIVQAHAEEMVLPRSLANPLRDVLGNIQGPNSTLSTAAADAGETARSSVSNNNPSFHYAPQISHGGTDMQTMLRKDGNTAKRWMMNKARNGGFK